MSSLIPIVSAEVSVPVDRLLQAFLTGRSPKTMEAYRADLAAFAKEAGLEVNEAVKQLLAAGPAQANLAVLTYRNQLKDAGRAPATINRRLAAIRSLLKLAQMLGMVTWTLTVDPVSDDGPRDMRGPGKDGFDRLLAEAAKQKDIARAERDVAILWLLFGRALRRGEVCGLRMSDLMLTQHRIAVLGKGRSHREPLTIAPAISIALEAWVKRARVNVLPDDAVFISLDPVNHGHALTANAVYKIVRGLGVRAGLGHVRPHGLRHAAITAVLDANGGDVRKARVFSRHRSVETLQRYDDSREDFGGEMSDLISKKDS